jgi:hypothetical protein
MCSVLWEHQLRAAFPKEITLVVSNAYEEGAFSREVTRIFPQEPEGESREGEE